MSTNSVGKGKTLVSFSYDDELVDILDGEAKDRGWSRARLLRLVVNNWFKKGDDVSLLNRQQKVRENDSR